jgi:sulfate permease, SulP family
VSLVELVENADGRVEERNAPKRLAPGKPTVLDIYGNLFFAGARTLERRLPDPDGAQNAVLILRLRGRTSAGATLIDVLSDYAERLQAVNGRLYLSGISDEMHDQLARTDKLRLAGPVAVYEATPVLGEATRRAYEDAQAWLVGSSKGERE